MSGDKLTFDLANEIEDVPNVFVRKDWVNVLDNQNGNYNSNQSVIDTSQLSNSNKWMSYREGYLATPMLLTLTSGLGANILKANTPNESADFAVGLKNWFGSIIHSLTLDFNGTTVIQQTPFINMWNSFKLMTSLSWQDVASFGSTMGFYPDDPLSWSYEATSNQTGKGVCNNTNMAPPFNLLRTKVGLSSTAGATNGAIGALRADDNQFRSGLGNEGFLRRQLYVNYDPDALCGTTTSQYGGGTAVANAVALRNGAATSLWKSYIFNKIDSAAGAVGVLQIAVMGFIHLRHIHSFFNQIPLIKGAFMKLTLNLNNCSTNFTCIGTGTNQYRITGVSNSVGGINPIMLASRARTNIGCINITNTAGVDPVVPFFNGAFSLNRNVLADTASDSPFIASLSVGPRCLNSSQSSLVGVQESPLSRSIVLYVPAYSFNAVFEQAYISSPIKKVIYEDIYQYQVLDVASGGQINNLLTNGIANLRSILVLPFYSSRVTSDNINVGPLCASGIPVYQSPFDPAGTGPTSPLCLLTNFNVVVSGQNAIYNTERYSFEQFINQTYGANSVNAGMTDGLSSSLIDQLGWEMEYCYHYVDVSRMLPVEQQVPKSVQIIGENTSVQRLDLFCFLAYGCELSFDILSGSRI
jgi:hypothetical protein